MKSRAALLHAVGEDWQVEEIEVDAPKAGEVVVEWKAAGLCHSDEHLVTGDMVPPEEIWPLMGIDEFFPMLGGHEGAGVVVELGPGIDTVAVGDHVSASLNPRVDIPKLLNLYREGQLKLDELITKRYALDEINVGYQAMRDGENIRGVIVHG
jgi:Zn-dependent alcohol dehydrogenase